MKLYKDKSKLFLINALKKIDYLNFASEDLLNQLVAVAKIQWFETGNTIFVPDDFAEAILIVQVGIIELYTTFDGTDLVIETLGRGCVLNPKNFLTREKLRVSARCQSSVSCFTIDTESFISIIFKDQMMKRRIVKMYEYQKVNEEITTMDHTFIKPNFKTL